VAKIMDRRTFIGTLVVGLHAAPLVARAQPANRVRRLGLLMVEEFPIDQRQDIRAALWERGWIEDTRNQDSGVIAATRG